MEHLTELVEPLDGARLEHFELAMSTHHVLGEVAQGVVVDPVGALRAPLLEHFQQRCGSGGDSVRASGARRRVLEAPLARAVADVAPDDLDLDPSEVEVESLGTPQHFEQSWPPVAGPCSPDPQGAWSRRSCTRLKD